MDIAPYARDGITIRSATGRMLYGGDYNPEQWPREVWDDDMRLFAEAHINEVTLNVFSWARLQPSEDVFDFSELDAIIALARKYGLAIILATSTAALPAWMSLRHTEVNRVDADGVRNRHGGRHNANPSSPVFLRFAAGLAGRLAERYGSLDEVVAWHISNEYGGFDYSPETQTAYRTWLRERYGTIDALNDAWYSAFWSHTYTAFDEIFPPDAVGEDLWDDKAVLPGAALDFRRFFGEQVRRAYRVEAEAIRAHDPSTPITTNFMGSFKDYDYFTWGDDLDIVSWDSYPRFDTPASEIALRHDLMRGVGRGKPFLLMEQTPSRQNWQPFNSMKRPGQLRSQSWQAIAHGADSIEYFQLRRSRGATEKFHGAVIETDGTDRTRVFREVAALGAELDRVGGGILGSRRPARVALVFDWPSWWALDASAGPTVSLDYRAELHRWYAELHRRNIPVDLVRAAGPFDDYDVVLAPLLYLTEAPAVDALRAFVDRGGHLLTTTMSFLVDEHDRLHQGETPVPIRDLAGVWAEETDALPPEHPVPLRFGDDAGAQHPASGSILFDVLRPDPGAEVLARYDAEYYRGEAAITYHEIGAGDARGGVLYVGTFPDAEGVRLVIDRLLDGTGIAGIATPEGVEVSLRVRDDGRRFRFFVNTRDHPASVAVPSPGVELLSRTELSAGALELDAFDVAVIDER